MGATGDTEQPRGPGGAERGGLELGDAGAAGQPVLTNPWNIMIKHRQVQRRGRRSQMTTSFTDPAISMDLLRAVLQPSINEEIQSVFNKYMKFFQKAALNVRDNVGEEVDAEQLIQEACRSCLEQAKLLFSDGEKVIPRLAHELPGIKRGRQAEEETERWHQPEVMGDAKESSSSHNRTEGPRSSQTLWQCARGLHRFKSGELQL